MPLDRSSKPPDGPALSPYQHGLALSIEALNARIARLAIGLGVPLDTEAEIAQVMNLKHPASTVAHERRTHQDGIDVTHLGANPDRRVAHKFEELRGLLVLRYGVESRYVNDVGADATRQIMSDAEASLERDGFKPGADGINLKRLFNQS